jgi:osmotically-inducible protein OsmY
MSNTQLRTRVEDELLWDPMVDSGAIAVSAEGGAVTLRGTVGTYGEKLDATNAANRVDGVQKVYNDLDVDLIWGDRRPDTDLRAEVLQALMLDSRVPSSVDAIVRDGVVTLTGTAKFEYERDEAESVAGHARGVTRVENRILLADD